SIILSPYVTRPQTHRPVSPVPSCVSMKSDQSMELPLNFSSGPPQSDPKCVVSYYISHFYILQIQICISMEKCVRVSVVSCSRCWYVGGWCCLCACFYG